MKFWRITYMIKDVEKAWLVAADKSCSKEKILITLQEAHPEWINLKVVRTRKPRGSYPFQKQPERPRKLRYQPTDW